MRPWNLPLVPSARSARSTSTTSKPRSAASQATPAPVAPPPITRTSVLSVAMGSAYRVIEGGRSGRPHHYVLAVSAACVEPVEGPGHRALPVLVVLVALLGVHVGLPALVLGPVVADLLL